MYDLIPLDEIDDQQKFTCGERFRMYQVGMNNVTAEDDYHEYMLVDNHDEFMIAANVSEHAGAWIKAGYVLAHVMKHSKDKPNVVSGKALKYSFGTSNVVWLKRKTFS